MLAGLTAAVDALQGVDAGEVDCEVLGALIVDARRQIERAEASWTHMVDRFDTRAGWKHEAVSMKTWLRTRCRIAPGAAGR